MTGVTMAPGGSTWRGICVLANPPRNSIQAACFQPPYRRGVITGTRLWDISYQQRGQKKIEQSLTVYTSNTQRTCSRSEEQDNFCGIQSCCQGCQSVPQREWCESCRQRFTGTDAPNAPLTSALWKVRLHYEFCISPLTHSHTHTAKVWVSGQEVYFWLHRLTGQCEQELQLLRCVHGAFFNGIMPLVSSLSSLREITCFNINSVLLPHVCIYYLSPCTYFYVQV